MTKRRIIDTNLIVRHLVQDHEEHARVASKLFAACDRGLVVLVILPAVLAECVFVLESFYKHSRPQIARTLASLISSPGVEIPDVAVHLDALERYRASKLHFVDCTIVAMAATRRIPVATFDSGFKRFTDIAVELE